MTNKTSSTAVIARPPIVAVLGHVDHGKTSLLDFIRHTTLAAKEHGGITQSIGAYQIEFKKNLITFIDTPGHEAFAKMRSRGASAADIAILVVAADDGVKPQTRESIEQIKAAGIPFIVAMNKVDLPTANISKVKQDLAKVGVQVEGFGGDIPVVQVSAKVGTGVPELLDMLILLGQMNELQGDAAAPLEAVVVETRLDKGKGMVASVIVKQGIIKSGMTIFESERQVAKVRALFDEWGKSVDIAGPSKPVEILGFTISPPVGSVLRDHAIVDTKPITTPVARAIDELPDFLKPLSEQKPETLKIVIKTDTAGSLEAILAALNARVEVVYSGMGPISEADILFAKSTKAFIVGFNVICPTSVEKLAQTEKVIFRTYTIIYELLDEMNEVISGMKEVITQERELGNGQILAEFPFEGQRIAGTRITSGRLARGDSIKVMRGEQEIARAKIKSVRHGKDEITKVEIGGECGILFDKKVDFLLNDAIIAVTS